MPLQEPLTFGEVLDLYQKMHQERDKFVAEMEEGKAKIESVCLKADQRIKEIDTIIHGFGATVGKYLERTDTIRGKRGFAYQFRKLDYNVLRANKNVIFYDETNKPLCEIDVLLEGNDTAILIEIKINLKTVDVRSHLKRLEKYRNYMNTHGDKKTIFAAVAGFVITEDAKKCANENGLYVFNHSGKFFDLATDLKDFKPKKW